MCKEPFDVITKIDITRIERRYLCINVFSSQVSLSNLVMLITTLWAEPPYSPSLTRFFGAGESKKILLAGYVNTIFGISDRSIRFTFSAASDSLQVTNPIAAKGEFD